MMMDYFEDNMKLLKQYRKSLYERYEEKADMESEWKYPCEQIDIQEAKDGNVIFSVTRHGKKLRLNSPYRPVAEAEKWAEQYPLRNMKTNILFFGMGNMVFAAALLKKMQEDGKLFIYEPCLEIFTAALHYVDMKPFIEDGRIYFFFEDINPEEFYEHVRKYTHWTNIQSQVVCHHTGYEQLFDESYLVFLKLVQKNIKMTQVNKDTGAHFSKRTVINSVKNMRYIKDSRMIGDYVGKIPRDIPAIIVSAGPSLDKNIMELKKAKGKAFIVAVDTAVRHLVKHGIMPDAMVTLDAGKPASYISDEQIKDIPLFCGLESNHEIMEFHTGIKIWFKGGFFLEQLYKRYGKEFPPYQPGGSVATAAFAVCCALEFERIVFVGQDLAYKGDVTHAGGAVSRVLNEEYGIQMIEGIDGKPVKSRHDWIIYLDWFEEAISDMKDRIEVIDATEGGAMIHGSRIMELAEAIDRYCRQEVNIEGILRQQPPTYTEKEYQKLRKEITGYLDEVKLTKKVAEKAEEACKEALELLKKDSQNVRMNQLQKDISQANTKIEKQNIYNLMDIYISKVSTKYLSNVFLISEDAHKDEINMYQSARMVYKAICDAAEELYPEFEQALQQIE